MKRLLIIIAIISAASAGSATGQAIGSISGTVRQQYDSCYGVEWDISRATPVMRRIGNMNMHRSLPVQSKMRRCLLLDDGTVNYYLSDTNSYFKENGIDSAVLDGTDGMVMVELPSFYWKFETSGNKERVWISVDSFPGAMRVAKCYTSAYEAALQRSVSKLSSVVNMTTDYRGGNNQSSWDGSYRTMLGKPATVIGRTNFRSYARNRGAGWNCDVYNVEKEVFWLRAVEYANMNCQLPFDASRDADGFRQGGLGDGVTTLVSTNWSDYNSYYPITPCGVTNTLGDSSGEIRYVIPGYTTGDSVVYVPSYRGIENPFGDIWKWVDGISYSIQSDDAGGESIIYVFDDPADFNDDDFDNARMVGNLPRSNNYMTHVQFGPYGDFEPMTASGGSSTTYWSDYFYTTIPASGAALRGLLLGGAATNGATAGVGYSSTDHGPSRAYTYFGSRLCFLP